MYARVKEHCDKRAMTMADLSYKSRVAQPTLQYMHRQKVSLKTINKISEALELTKDEIEELVNINANMPSYKEVKK